MSRMKTCRHCGISKPLDQFSKSKTCTDGLRSQCKACRQKTARAWKARNRPRLLEKKRKWNAEHAEQLRAEATARRRARGSKQRMTLAQGIAEAKASVSAKGCWVWQGTIKDDGYAQLGSYRAYRLVYKLLVGRIPKGRHVHHTCRNRACVNPDHLLVVTPKEHKRLHR